MSLTKFNPNLKALPFLQIIVLFYLFGMLVHILHFHAKFEEYNVGLANAAHSEQYVYRRAAMLAHGDTALAPFWPLLIHRWNVDYVAEVRRSDR